MQKRTSRYGILVSLVAGVAYSFPQVSGAESDWAFVVKWLALAGAGYAVWVLWPGRQGSLLFFALVFHSLGDVLLSVDRTRLFLPSVGAFLIGHILYIVVYACDVRRVWPVRALIAAPIIVVHGAFMASVLLPKLHGVLLIAVCIYMTTILTMGVLSFAARYRTIWVPAGAVLFLISDSLLATNAFVQKLPIGPTVWLTYFAGQMLIAMGLLKEKLEKDWPV